jgi:hypothetical protein
MIGKKSEREGDDDCRPTLEGLFGPIKPIHKYICYFVHVHVRVQKPCGRSAAIFDIWPPAQDHLCTPTRYKGLVIRLLTRVLRTSNIVTQYTPHISVSEANDITTFQLSQSTGVQGGSHSPKAHQSPLTYVLEPMLSDTHPS